MADFELLDQNLQPMLQRTDLEWLDRLGPRARELYAGGIIDMRGEFISHLHMFNVNISSTHWVVPWHWPGGRKQPDWHTIMAYYQITKFRGSDWPAAWDEDIVHAISNCTHWVVLPTPSRVHFDEWLGRKYNAAREMQGSRPLKTEARHVGSRVARHSPNNAHMALLKILREFEINKPKERM